MGSLSDEDFVRVTTTLPAVPYPQLHLRQPVKTERLLLRPHCESDLDALHVLRRQPEVMIRTMQGKPDADMDATKKNLSKRLPPHDESNYDFAICLADGDSEAGGEFIGIGGSSYRKGQHGWPEVGYMLRKEAWGRGYGTEFVKAFMKIWWELPRVEAEIEVHKSTMDSPAPCGEIKVEAERMFAVTESDNRASQRVLSKCGLELVHEWEEENTHECGGLVLLYGYAAKRPTA